MQDESKKAQSDLGEFMNGTRRSESVGSRERTLETDGCEMSRTGADGR